RWARSPRRPGCGPRAMARRGAGWSLLDHTPRSIVVAGDRERPTRAARVAPRRRADRTGGGAVVAVHSTRPTVVRADEAGERLPRGAAARARWSSARDRGRGAAARGHEPGSVAPPAALRRDAAR